GVSTRSYDRSGRLGIESYEVSPSSGFSDPLAAYFSGGFIGGGLSGIAELSSKPYTMHRDLNEWVRFDSAGDYTVVVHITRVFSLDKANLHVREMTVTSNPIKLHIIAATPEWQKATLVRAVQALAPEHNTYGPVPDETAGAIADLRFLGSTDVIPVLVA